MKLLLHPTVNGHEAKRIANEQGVLLVFSNGRLRFKQRRCHRGEDASEVRALRNSMQLANRSLLMLELGNYDGAAREIRKAAAALDELIPETESVS
jgi:hypothetical protein